jgi:serine/threonine protein kinase
MPLPQWELVDGMDLLDLLNSRSPNRLSEKTARHYFRQLLAGVSFIHANGFCHRDIKPENCMIEAKTNRLKMCDRCLHRAFFSSPSPHTQPAQH